MPYTVPTANGCPHGAKLPFTNTDNDNDKSGTKFQISVGGGGPKPPAAPEHTPKRSPRPEQ